MSGEHQYLSKKTVKELIALHVTQQAARQTMGVAQETLVQYLFKVIDKESSVLVDDIIAYEKGEEYWDD